MYLRVNIALQVADTTNATVLVVAGVQVMLVVGIQMVAIQINELW